MLCIKKRIHTIINIIYTNSYELSYERHPVGLSALSGVPLTPAILEKNGWKKPDGFDSYWLGNIGLLQGGEVWQSVVGNTKIAIILGDIQYVHQLQHLLFGLGLNSEMEV